MENHMLGTYCILRLADLKYRCHEKALGSQIFIFFFFDWIRKTPVKNVLLYFRVESPGGFLRSCQVCFLLTYPDLLLRSMASRTKSALHFHGRGTS